MGDRSHGYSFKIYMGAGSKMQVEYVFVEEKSTVHAAAAREFARPHCSAVVYSTLE